MRFPYRFFGLFCGSFPYSHGFVWPLGNLYQIIKTRQSRIRESMGVPHLRCTVHPTGQNRWLVSRSPRSRSLLPGKLLLPSAVHRSGEPRKVCSSAIRSLCPISQASGLESASGLASSVSLRCSRYSAPKPFLRRKRSPSETPLFS